MGGSAIVCGTIYHSLLEMLSAFSLTLSKTSFVFSITSKSIHSNKPSVVISAPIIS